MKPGNAILMASTGPRLGKWGSSPKANTDALVGNCWSKVKPKDKLGVSCLSKSSTRFK